MKKSEIQELKNKPAGELVRLLKESRDAFRAMQFEVSVGKQKDFSSLRKMRRKIARIFTIINYTK